MNYFLSVSSAQWILIDLGVLLQVAAIVGVFKQRMGYRMLPPHSQQMRSYDLDETAPDNTNEEDPAHGRFGRPMKASNITKTSKAPFKQEFKFRQCR